VLYPRAKQALDRLETLLEHPKGTRMPSVAIYGDSGMGKTMIMKRFRDQHPPGFDRGAGVLKTPVLAMEMVSRPGERRFYGELLTQLGAPQAPRADIAQMEQAALRIMGAIGLQVLVIDEVHNILAGTYREQRIVLNTLRFLSNRLQISLVCFGVNEAREAIGGDVQLARRFEQLNLSRWAANEQFETLVASILRNTPLRQPSVLTPKTLRRILQITDGITANIFHMLGSLAIAAIESGSERITDDAVADWVPTFDTVRFMTFEKVAKPMHRFIAKAPIQSCAKCTQSNHGPVPIRRSQLQAWRITCPNCGGWLHDGTRTDGCEVLAPYRDAALRGEKLLHDESEGKVTSWGSPMELARLMLIRRISWPLPRENDLCRHRVLGVLIPEFDSILGTLTSFHHSPKHPILPLHIRPALLAGVDIVHRSGPEMLRMLQRHTFGPSREKFIQVTDHMVSPAIEWGPPQQMQLI
jgi:hypothetical protein